MFIIDFRNKNVSEYRFSVMGNSNVDKVHLYSLFTQYATGANIYLKIRSHDEDYVDKIAISSENISVEDGALLCKWTMGAVSTQCKKIYLQLQFEKEGEIIAQTGIVSLTLADTINVEQEIIPIYPEILKNLQKQIDTLKGEVIKNGSLSYANDTLSLTLVNKDSESLVSLQVAIPTSGSFVSSSLNEYVITLTKRNGQTEQIDLSPLFGAKVDKTNTANKLYGTNSQGNQTTYTVDSFYEGNVARRDIDNSITVPLVPTENGHATSKQYVDTIVANIKKDHYIQVDITTYPTLADFLASTGEERYMYLYPINTSESPTFESGYYRYVWENNAWLDLGTTQIDLNNYYQKNANLIPASNNAYDLGSSSRAFKDIYLKGYARVDKFRGKSNTFVGFDMNYDNIDFFTSVFNIGGVHIIENASYGLVIGNSTKQLFANNTFVPNGDNNKDLGTGSYKWKNLYLSGNFNNGTLSYTIAQAYSLFNLNESSADTEIKWYKMLTFSKTADTTFTFETAKTGCLCEYKAIITNIGASTITLTFTGITKILCNDDNCVATNGTNSTLTIPSGTTIEINAVNACLVAINFSAEQEVAYVFKKKSLIKLFSNTV